MQTEQHLTKIQNRLSELAAEATRLREEKARAGAAWAEAVAKDEAKAIKAAEGTLADIEMALAGVEARTAPMAEAARAEVRRMAQAEASAASARWGKENAKLAQLAREVIKAHDVACEGYRQLLEAERNRNSEITTLRAMAADAGIKLATMPHARIGLNLSSVANVYSRAMLVPPKYRIAEANVIVTPKMEIPA